ncbi:MAG TPA: ABC transporter substrate-binding protein, partial [Candidatus Eremiobacteraceae bacterium]|nr:ABC transporter substrate-binding protein [Candidatus Eremiobacteraceae bacterium]
PGVHVNDTIFDEYYYLWFNELHPPLDDPRVRRAIAMGVDRDYIVRTVMHDHVTKAQTDQPPFSWAADPDVHEPDFDPAGARRLLESLGWHPGADGMLAKNGQTLSLTLVTDNAWDNALRFAPVFQAEMAKIGIAITIKLYPTSVLESAAGAGGILNNGKYDIAFDGWVAGIDPDDSTLVECDQAPPVGWNRAHACDPRIDAQERIALTSYDQPTRRAAYWKIQQYLAQDLPTLILFYSKRNDAVRDQLADFRPAQAVTEFWNTWQWDMQ